MTRMAPWRAAALLAILPLFFEAGASAQSLPAQGRSQSPVAATDAMRALYDAAFQETLRKPADPATLVGFAEIAVRVGDLEGAISALDRLLLIDGDQPDLKLELGVLYFRLGSFEAARSYLDEVRTSARASTAAKARAAEYIKEIKRP